MCNEYQLRLPFEPGRWSEIKIPVRFGEAAGNRPLNTPFRPTDRAPMLRAIDPMEPAAGLEAVERRWWLVPYFHKGRVGEWKATCANARLESVDTTAAFREPYRRRRALIPLTSMIEYDEPPGWKKAKRRWAQHRLL